MVIIRFLQKLIKNGRFWYPRSSKVTFELFWGSYFRHFWSLSFNIGQLICIYSRSLRLPIWKNEFREYKSDETSVLINKQKKLLYFLGHKNITFDTLNLFSIKKWVLELGLGSSRGHFRGSKIIVIKKRLLSTTCSGQIRSNDARGRSKW